jgi:hypothetical protein
MTPAQTGLLRLVTQQPGQWPSNCARPPSRLVPLADHLEERGLIERRRDPEDRRYYALYLTAKGGQFMSGLAAHARPAHAAAAAVRGRPWKTSGYTDRPGGRTPSAMRPWMPQHRSPRRYRMTHGGTEKKRPA